MAEARSQEAIDAVNLFFDAGVTKIGTAYPNMSDQTFVILLASYMQACATMALTVAQDRTAKGLNGVEEAIDRRNG